VSFCPALPRIFLRLYPFCNALFFVENGYFFRGPIPVDKKTLGGGTFFAKEYGKLFDP